MTRHRAATRRGRPSGGGSRRGAALALVTVAAAVATVLTMISARGADAPATPSVTAEPGATRGAAPAPSPSAPAPDLADVVAAAEEAAEEAGPSGLDLGIAVLDRVTGVTESGATGDEVFNAASLTKLFVAVDVLDQRRRGAVDVDAADLRQVRSSLGPSSDPAMNALWSGFDGNAGVARLATDLGLADTAAPDDPSQWGEVQTSARDVVRLFGHVRDGVPVADRDVLLGALRDPPARAADGFDQGYGLLDGAAGDDAAGPAEPVKQGWLCCLRNSVDLHTAGIVADRWAVAVLTNQPRDWDRARTTVDAAVRSLRGSLAGTPTG